MKQLDVSDARFIRKQQILRLREQGYSIRAIMRLMGYRSPSPVHRLLKGEGLTKLPIDNINNK